MTIDINELRDAIQMFGAQAVNEGDLNELLDRLEAAEKERDALRAELLDANETVRELFHGAGDDENNGPLYQGYGIEISL